MIHRYNFIKISYICIKKDIDINCIFVYLYSIVNTLMDTDFFTQLTLNRILTTMQFLR